MPVARHAFSLQLTERCNLACRYCYVRKRKQRQELCDCSPDLCEQFIDFAFRESDDKVKITFFGGEPLLRPDLICHTVAYGREGARKLGKTIGFHLVTNGTLLDDTIGDFISREKIGLEVSIDGPATVHDSNRTYPDGTGSFQTVYAHLLRFVERHPDHAVSIFSVFTSTESLPWLQALCRGLEIQGFTFNPVRLPPEENQHEKVCRPLMPRELQQRIKLHREAFLRGDTGFDEGMNQQISCLLGGCVPNRCEAGINGTITVQSGSIYPCPFFVGHEDQVIGDVAQGFYPDKVQPFLERAADIMKRCRRCRAERVCGGGCAFDAYEQSGRINVPPRSTCTIIRKYVKSFAESIIALASKRPEQLLEKTLGLPARVAPIASVCPSAPTPHSFVVRLTGRCNLACDYCFEKSSGAGDDHLDLDTGRSIVNQILESTTSTPLVCLFGGEPLLNWETGEFIIEEVAQGATKLGKRPFFHITTNGTLISREIARTISRYAVTVQVSIDGPKEQHDRHRKYPDGRGSYEAVLRGLEILRSESTDVRIDAQVVLTPGNFDMVGIARDLDAMGFQRLSFLVCGWEKHTGVEWSIEDIETLMHAREAFFPFFLESTLRGRPEVDMGFAGLVAAEPEGSRGLCECGTGEVYIDSRGESHLCPQLYARGSYRTGNCAPSDNKIRLELPAAGKAIDADCLDCWAFARCGGGCMVRCHSCPWITSSQPAEKRRIWCDLMRAEFARVIIAHRLLEGHHPESLRKLKSIFTV